MGRRRRRGRLAGRQRRRQARHGRRRRRLNCGHRIVTDSEAPLAQHHIQNVIERAQGLARTVLSRHAVRLSISQLVASLG